MVKIKSQQKIKQKIKSRLVIGLANLTNQKGKPAQIQFTKQIEPKLN